ncbi:MAG: hypothetical protein EKK63_05205 [Acinetobacter sp.]|uniref:dynamin family protein n=1 Tax=Acinetobacter sp. TaxID=472 RepID=UPI000FB1E753|nr:dynamin family protein [Acinetobacter sp.]RUP41434.1 MAG: hypothetical protein EKK63_05205 [Acinetobacter sp.]
MTAHQHIQDMIDELPERHQGLVQDIWQSFNDQGQNLTLALVGAFSVGKTSLLNSLLGERWLFTAQEEATALPTLIQYAEKQDIQLIYTNQSSVELDREQFCKVTTIAPDNAKYAMLSLPQDWLKCLKIIDLPGFGSISEKHQAYTIAQIQQADAILYLLAPRGASSSDIDAIKLIRSYGKHVLVLVNRWDEVETAVSLGEKKPDLDKWSEQIKIATGYDVPLICSHRNGLNHELILDFINQAKEQVNIIRTKRLFAELRPRLENILGHNQEQQQANQLLDEQQSQTLHQLFLQKKEKIIDIKKDLYQQQEQQQHDLQRLIIDIFQRKKNNLRVALNELKVTPEQWEIFINQGSQAIRLIQAELIQAVQQAMQKFGQINLPENTINDLNLRLPELPKIDEQDFLQSAVLYQLKQEFAKNKNEVGQTISSDKVFSDTELKQLEEQIADLSRYRQDVLNQYIPNIEERIYDTSGSDAGRAIGEVIDWALFFLPAAAVTKVGKLAKLSETAIKTVHTVQKTARVAKKTVEKMPPSTAGQILNLLSIATWTEKLGGLLNNPSQIILKPDPEIQAQVTAQAQKINADIQNLHDDLIRKQDLITSHQLEQIALEQKQKEILRIEQRIVQLENELKEQQVQAQREQEQQQAKILQTYYERAVRQWLTQFDHQSQGIEQHIQQYIKGYWETVIHEQLATRIEEITNIEQQINQLPLQKEQKLRNLQDEEAQLRVVLVKLNEELV